MQRVHNGVRTVHRARCVERLSHAPMSVSNKKRFGVFERDSFTCQYCGKKPPDVVLQADHIVSRKDGGDDSEMNLVTSCFACNNGKSSKSLDIRTIRAASFKQELEILEARKGQLEAYFNFLKRKAEVEDEETNIYQRCWEEESDGESTLTDKGLRNMRSLAERYSSAMIFEAIRIAWSKSHVSNEAKFPYMCGVLKNLKLQSEDPETAEASYALNRSLSLIRNAYPYFNEGFLRKFLPEMPEVIVGQLVNESNNWTQLKNAILTYCDVAED